MVTKWAVEFILTDKNDPPIPKAKLRRAIQEAMDNDPDFPDDVRRTGLEMLEIETD